MQQNNFREHKWKCLSNFTPSQCNVDQIKITADALSMVKR